MGWKRIIAKEWLFILGFAVLCLLIFFGVNSTVPSRVNPPVVSIPVFERMDRDLIKSMVSGNSKARDRISSLIDTYVTGVSEELISQGYSSGKSIFQDAFDFDILEYFSNDERRFYDSVISIHLADEIIDSSNYDYSDAIGYRDSLRLLALERWYNQYDKYQTYLFRSRFVNSIPIFVYFLPYPIFLLLRTILWAIRQVKKKPNLS